MSKTKNISEFGYSFQIKFIVCLITDKLFLEQIVDILDEKYINNDGFKWLVKTIREYYQEYKTTITMEVFKIKIQEIESDLLQVNVKDCLKEVFKSMEAEDLEYIKDKALDFSLILFSCSIRGIILFAADKPWLIAILIVANDLTG